MKTNELVIITLAIVILIATYITIDPNITGFAILQPNFNTNENILINNTIQLKQHQITHNTTNIEYIQIATAEKTEPTENSTILTDELENLVELDNESTILGKEDSLNIQFEDNIEIINLYLQSNKEPNLNINNNSIIYLDEGFYQLNLQTDELTITTSETVKINYINASKLQTTQSSTYYYTPSEIESETLEEKDWDLFTSNFELNNQTLKFFYKTNQSYIEFTPPYNFSEINSNLQFKIFLDSNNQSTPIIYNLSINYIEEIPENNTEPPEPESSPSPPSSTQAPSSKYSTSKITTPKIETPKIQTKTISQPIELKTTPPKEQEVMQDIQIKTLNKPKIIANTIAISYLSFLCLLIYKRRHQI